MPWDPIGMDPPPVSAAAFSGEPDPTETAWTLTPSGVTWGGRAVAGFDLALAGVLKNAGAPLIFDPAAVLDAAVWRGRGGPPVLAPAAAWISAPDGLFSLAIPGAASAGLDPGTYRLQVGVAAGGSRSLAYDGTLTIADAPGTAAARTPYVTAGDLLFYYDQLPRLRNPATDDTGFLAQRINASDEFDRDFLVRYDPRPGYIKTRRLVPHPQLGLDVSDPAAAAPTPAQLRGYLAAGGLIVDRNVRELVARRAVADLLDRQETMGPNAFRETAAEQRALADRLWQGFDVQIDTSSPLDGVADLLVGRDVLLLPPGTAP